MTTPSVDIIIPVFNEGENILATLSSIAKSVKSPAQVLICYDYSGDNTLPAIRNNPGPHTGLNISYVLNKGRGVHSAIMEGFAAGTAPFTLVYPADDDYNAGIIDSMVALAEQGADVVCASRFMPGGSMIGCPPLKAFLVRAGSFTLYHLAGIPSHDSSNGLRLFSRRLIDRIAIESDSGFCFSIELLAKAHRLGLKVAEVPAQWIERKQGASRFKLFTWLPSYLRWYFYAFATTFLRRPASSVPLASSKRSESPQ